MSGGFGSSGGRKRRRSLGGGLYKFILKPSFRSSEGSGRDLATYKSSSGGLYSRACCTASGFHWSSRRVRVFCAHCLHVSGELQSGVTWWLGERRSIMSPVVIMWWLDLRHIAAGNLALAVADSSLGSMKIFAFLAAFIISLRYCGKCSRDISI